VIPANDTVALPAAQAAAAPWNAATRIAFRFVFLYFGSYVLTTQMLSSLVVLPVGDVPDLSYSAAAVRFLSWMAVRLFRVTQFAAGPTGSGDRLLDWMQSAALLFFAAIGTAAWTASARRVEYRTVQKWFWVFLRFSLGATMIGYGMAKAIPLQMPAPSLSRLLEPYGDFSPMGVLWYSIGASFPYEHFVGSAELLAGILLFVPQLWMLGAMVALADATEIFSLNMTYDVPVKLFSFHLILMSLVLLAPEMRRLANVLVLNRATGPSAHPPLFSGRRAMRIAVAVQLVLGAYLVGMNVYGSYKAWFGYGGGAPKSPLYGIWKIEEMAIDGQVRAPLLTDFDRWKHLTFQGPSAMGFQRMDETFGSFGAKIDMAGGTIALTKPTDKTWKGQLGITRPDANTMTLDGALGGHPTRMRLRRVDHTQFRLLSRGFHWLQESPFNR